MSVQLEMPEKTKAHFNGKVDIYFYLKGIRCLHLKGFHCTKSCILVYCNTEAFTMRVHGLAEVG